MRYHDIGEIILDTEDREFIVRTERDFDNHEIHAVSVSVTGGNYVRDVLTIDPTTPQGDRSLTDLIAALTTAQATARSEVERLYGSVEVGEYAYPFRATLPPEDRCTWWWPAESARCSRAPHADGHHIHVNRDGYATHVAHPAPAAPVDAVGVGCAG